MKSNPVPLIAAILVAYTSFAQTDERFRLTLSSGSFIPEKNITAERINELSRNTPRIDNKTFLLIQFEKLPNESDKQRLIAAGIELKNYIPNNTFTAIVKGTINQSILSQLSARAVIRLTGRQKLQSTLSDGSIPAWASRIPGTTDLWISIPNGFDMDKVYSDLKAMNYDILPTAYSQYRIIAVRIASGRLNELADLPYVEYVQPAPKEDEPVNNNNMSGSKANVLSSTLPGGRALKGEGVVVGIGDDANPLNHIDFNTRIINRTWAPGGTHGVHVTGTIGGAGIVAEKYAGFAPKSKMVSQLFSNILANAPVYVQDYGMVITNNSYGNVTNDCRTFGVYDLYSRVIDQQAFQMPNLQHVFAAGNSGNYSCTPYPAGFSNVLGAYQTAKNAISVGNITELGVLLNTSSKGPVRDGRIKPEIVSQGTFTISTWPYNTYSYSSGTSMSSPAISGGLALLYQRYRQLNGNADPQNGLMKALLCNGATDIGNPGPDYSYGFGWMNLLRSVKMLENNTYFQSNVSAGGNNTHNITIGAGISQLKVMLYWNDSAAAVLASKALVNDLDLEVDSLSLITVYPQLLDTIPANVNQPATTGPDHFNNIEQVVIKNPAPGTYTLRVKGTTIPLALQHSYYLVYDTLPVSLTLTYPVGKERLEPNESPLYISWDAYGNPGNDFLLEYTANNGGSWTTIAPNAPAGSRIFSWTTATGPATSQARIRITQNGTGLQSMSDTFTIMGKPTISLSAVQCPGYINIDWTAVAGATDYEVMLLRGDEMVPVGNTIGTNFSIAGLSTDSIYWFSVRARLNGVPGRRANALSTTPSSGTCAGTISDNDLKLEQILSPISSGRKFTSSELYNANTITIRIRNLDDVATTGNIAVRYVLGANPAINETITAPNIPAGGTFDYSFIANADLSAVGTYNLKVNISYSGDLVSKNDTINKVYRQLANPFIDLTTDFLDDLETATVQQHTSRQVGLEGLDRYDFVPSNNNGRIRSFVNSGIAYSGSKALSMDVDHYTGTGSVDSLTATFNLNGYNVATDDIRLDFQYKQHGQAPHAANNLWIRGDDQKPWILALDLYANQADPGVFRLSPSIELKNILNAAGQSFSTSLQARWGQYCELILADNETAAGYTYDNIRLYRAIDDIQLVRIDTPLVASCNLSSTVPVRITLRNSSSSAINNIPVFLEIDGATPISEVIGTIAANTTVSYQFTATANLTSAGSHTVRVWSDYLTDNFASNDTATVVLYNSPQINTFPYLENFELSDGGWHADGQKSSWAYGTPVAPFINGAASGSKAWKTNLAASYNDNEVSFLYSPCFNVSGLTNPMLSFSLALDLEDCGASPCDIAYVEYSQDGVSWTKLGSMGAGTNWYNKNYAGFATWSIQNYTRWHVASIPLPTGLSQLRLRFALQSDPYVSREGIGIDDIHIYDLQYPIYQGAPYTSNQVNQPAVSGNNWINFTDGGQIVAAVNPNGQNLGSTDAQVFINTSGIRNRVGQYYHDRNITIKPATTALTDSATVRFYFLDTETEALINATGCGLCTKPVMANRLGVSKFSSTNDAIENGSLTDDAGGTWLFIPAANAVKVPYDRGYYAEFKVKDFSEFWLNNGGPNNNQALPVELTKFTADKIPNGDVLLQWVTASENNTARFEVELARDNSDLQSNNFTVIGTVNSQGNSSSEQFYTLTDKELNKSGVRFYRLRIVDHDGRFTYSAIRPVIFDESVKWQIYPNPSGGLFNVVYQASPGDIVEMKLMDVNGRPLIQNKIPANGFQQKSTLDISGVKYAKGMYILQIVAGEKRQLFNLIKQ